MISVLSQICIQDISRFPLVAIHSNDSRICCFLDHKAPFGISVNHFEIKGSPKGAVHKRILGLGKQDFQDHPS